MSDIKKELEKARKEIEMNEEAKKNARDRIKKDNSRERNVETRKAFKITRENRIPYTVSSGLIQPQIPGYYTYGFVAEDKDADEIYRALQAGYIFIYDYDENERNTGKISCKPAGAGLYLYWMKIPLEFKKDDWERERKERLAILEQINNGINMAHDEMNEDNEISSSIKQLLGKYKGKVKIENKISQLNHPR